METCKAKGTLDVPEWKSAPFWPLLYSYDCAFLLPEFVKDFCYLPRSRDMFLPGRAPLLYILTRSPFFRACPNLMFSPLDWILPASRIRLDLMIARMFFFCLFLQTSFSSWIVV